MSDNNEQQSSETTSPKSQTLTIGDIERLLPHRYPFLLVDRVVGLIPGEEAVGIKNVTMNEEFFQGHFPGNPVMPGVLQLEAMAQTAGLVALTFLGESAHGKAVYFMGIDGAKFRRPVVPGDQLRMHLTKERGGGKVWKFDAKGMVDGQIVVEAKLTAMLG